MIRNETFRDGICIQAEVIDLEAGTYAFEKDGVTVEGPRPLTVDEVRRYGPQPLDAVGALATLLAVQQVVSVQDAANAVGLSEQDLVNEALAWGAASQ